MLVGACGGPAAQDRVDGWTTGGFLEACAVRPTALSSSTCAAMVPPALAAIADDRPVKTVKVYEEGAYIDASGTAILANRGGGPVRVVVVTFEDGSRRGAGVYCGIDPVDSGSTAPCVVVTPPLAQ